ncbi:MAG: hypothetical protein AB1758_04720, partial [Candidatus Eremiobacterota bacterium]
GIEYVSPTIPIEQEMLIAHRVGMDPSGQPIIKREIDDFHAEMIPNGWVARDPKDMQKDVDDAFKTGKEQALPKGFAPILANSRQGMIIEKSKMLVGTFAQMGSGMSLMSLANWNAWIPLSLAAPLAGIGGLVSIYTGFDQMKEIANNKGRLQFFKAEYDAMTARQDLLKAEPETGKAYLAALDRKFNAQLGEEYMRYKLEEARPDQSKAYFKALDAKAKAEKKYGYAEASAQAEQARQTLASTPEFKAYEEAKVRREQAQAVDSFFEAQARLTDAKSAAPFVEGTPASADAIPQAQYAVDQARFAVEQKYPGLLQGIESGAAPRPSSTEARQVESEARVALDRAHSEPATAYFSALARMQKVQPQIDAAREAYETLKEVAPQGVAAYEQSIAQRQQVSAEVAQLRDKLPAELAARFDSAVEDLADKKLWYAQQRGDQTNIYQARIESLSAEGVGTLPGQKQVKGPDGKTRIVMGDVPIEEHIKNLNQAMITPGLTMAAGATTITLGILAAVGIAFPPALAVGAMFLPLAGMLYRPLTMLGKGLIGVIGNAVKGLWDKVTQRDKAPTTERALEGKKAKPETPEEQAAYDRAIERRQSLLNADADVTGRYLDGLIRLRTASSEQDAQAAGEELKTAREALMKVDQKGLLEFESSLRELDSLTRERGVTALMNGEFYQGLLNSETIQKFAGQLGKDEHYAPGILRTLLRADARDQTSMQQVQTWLADAKQNPNPSADAQMAVALIQVSAALEQGQAPPPLPDPSAKPAPQPATAPTNGPNPAPPPEQTQVQFNPMEFILAMRLLQDPEAIQSYQRAEMARQQGDSQAAQFVAMVEQADQQLEAQVRGTLKQKDPQVLEKARSLLMQLNNPETSAAAQQELITSRQAVQGGDQAAFALMDAFNCLVLEAQYDVKKAQLAAQAGQPPATPTQTQT